MSSETIVSALFLISAVIAAGILINAMFPAIYRTSGTFGSVSQQADTRMRTDFTIEDAATENTYNINCTINNTGKEIISDFKHMDVIVYDFGTQDFRVYPYSATAVTGTWTIIDKGQEIIHPSELDPGETYRILIQTTGSSPVWFQITTGNGVYDSRKL